MSQEFTFGNVIAETRKKKNISQKELATKLGISPQYLNDIEHNKRNPSSQQLIDQIAETLEIEREYLCYLAGRLPDEIINLNLDKDSFQTAWVAFRKNIEKK
jgi:transcriptional regulator with XRE-family HTH domain